MKENLFWMVDSRSDKW